MPDWRSISAADGSRGLICPPLARSGLAHLFTLRPLRSPARSPAGWISPTLLVSAGLEGLDIATPIQIHGARIASPSHSGGTTEPERADGVIVRSGPRAAAIATADCVGIILYAAEARAFAVVHAGWRGTLARILEEAIAVLSRESGASPLEMSVAMGPAIGGCCYEVGEEVLAPFHRAYPESAWPRLFGWREGRRTLDLIAANRILAAECGVAESLILDAGICTSCRRDLCWSYRAEGAASGRMWTIAGLTA
jgi:YfiH family protein